MIDLAAGRSIDEIAVVRDPAFAALNADESRLVVAHYLPSGAGTDPDLAAEVSILDTRAWRLLARVKLPPGSTMAGGVWISHRETHEISILNIGVIHELLQGIVPDDIAARKEGARENLWVRIKHDRKQIKQLSKDLTALRLADAIRRFPSGGQGPTGLAL